MGFATEFAAAYERHEFIRHGRVVYEIRPIVSGDLWAVGFAHLEGSGAYGAALEEHEQELKRLRLGVKDSRKPLEEREKLRRELEERAGQVYEARLRNAAKSEHSRRAWLQRCDAHICAAVVGAGRIGRNVEIATPNEAERVTELPEAWGVEIDHDFRFVAVEGDHDPEAGRVFVGLIGEPARALLGSALIALREVGPRRAALGFPAGSGAIGGRRPAAPEVPGVHAGDPVEGDPGGDRDSVRGDGGGGRGGRAADRPSERGDGGGGHRAPMTEG